MRALEQCLLFSSLRHVRLRLILVKACAFAHKLALENNKHYSESRFISGVTSSQVWLQHSPVHMSLVNHGDESDRDQVFRCIIIAILFEKL